MATEMFKSLSYIPGFVDGYSSELSMVESAADRMQARIERERARLFRSDGQPVYAPAEMQAREEDLVAAATAEYDQSVSRYAAKAEQETADLKKQLAQLEGADGWERLTESQQQTASNRREFVREDAMSLSAPELAARARASIAAGNLAECWLLRRYIGQRITTVDENGLPAARARNDRDLELLAAQRELGMLFGDEDRAERRRELEAKLRAATSFPLAIERARSIGNGSDARALAQFRQHMTARF